MSRVYFPFLQILDTYESNSDEEEAATENVSANGGATDANQSDSLDLDSRIAQLMGNQSSTGNTTSSVNQHRKSNSNQRSKSSTLHHSKLHSQNPRSGASGSGGGVSHKSVDNEEDEIYNLLGV